MGVDLASPAQRLQVPHSSGHRGPVHLSIFRRPQRPTSPLLPVLLPLHQVSELRDAISCVADEVVGPSQGTAHRAYMFMEGTFYNDTRRPDAQDHVRPIVDLCRWEGRAGVGRHTRACVWAVR